MHSSTSGWLQRLAKLFAVLSVVAITMGAAGSSPVQTQTRDASEWSSRLQDAGTTAIRLSRPVVNWYERTPAIQRLSWGGMLAGGLLGSTIVLGRWRATRRSAVLPAAFTNRWYERVKEQTLERSKGFDLCEVYPSPASRVVEAALKRWGRPAAEIERAVVIACRAEEVTLRGNMESVRRLATLMPMIGLMGTLGAAGDALRGARNLESISTGVANALTPLTVGLGLAVLALVIFDGLSARCRKVVRDLDRLGTDAVDAISVVGPSVPPVPAVSPASTTVARETSSTSGRVLDPPAQRPWPSASPHVGRSDRPLRDSQRRVRRDEE